MFTVLLTEFSVLIIFIRFFGIDLFTMLNSAIQLDLNFNFSRMNLLDNVFVASKITGTRGYYPPFFRKKKFPVFFFLFGICVINLCYINRDISLFHIIREISLFPQVYYPAPATTNINILNLTNIF